jgi:hypothetical protein
MLITCCDQVIPALYPDYLAAIQEAMGQGISPEGLDSIHDHKAKHVHKQTRYVKDTVEQKGVEIPFLHSRIFIFLQQ